ncbi:MAG TPA: diguanylate cyclase [Rhodoferax sp.]|nr:diguanylate cyclase [Rhodoferax sp.]
MHQNLSLHERLKRPAVQWPIWTGLMLVMGLLIGVVQWREYREIGRTEREHLLTQVRVADQLLTSQIQSADAALRTMLEGLDRWRGPEGYLPFAHEHLKRVEKMMPGARTFAVLDAQGICQLSNRHELIGMDLSGRDYFARAKAGHGSAELRIAAPYRTVLGAWAATISRPITRADGTFGGVVVATLSPEYFEDVMKTLRYAPDMRVTLLHDEGQIYVTSPPDQAILARDYSNTSNFFSEHLRSGLAESYQGGNSLDERKRFGMVRTVALGGIAADHRFVAVAGRESSAVYGPWRMETAVLVGLWLAILLGSGWGLAQFRTRAKLLRRQAQEAEQAMQRSNQRFEQMASAVPCVLFDFEVAAGMEPRLLYVGPYSTQLLGRTPEEFSSQPGLFLQSVHPDDARELQAAVERAFSHKASFDCDIRFTTPQGQERWVKMTAMPVASDHTPDVHRYSGFLSDITLEKTQQLVLKDLAYRDPLTRAENRRSFMEKTQAELARIKRGGAEASVIMLDIDFFKNVNDTYGHDVGDAVLKHLVAVLRACLRSMDALGRLGGEEFAVLLPETSLESAVLLAERLRQAVQASPAVEAGYSVPFTISLGVAPLRADVPDVKSVLKLADRAMYQAKNTGRNRVVSVSDLSPAA